MVALGKECAEFAIRHSIVLGRSLDGLGLLRTGRSLARGVRQAPASVGRDWSRDGAKAGTGVPCPYTKSTPRRGFGMGQRWVLAAMAPAAAPMASHLALRAMRRRDASPFGGADGCVALVGEDGGLGAFVGQVGLGGGQFGLAGSAVEGEVVERLEIVSGEDGLS